MRKVADDVWQLAGLPRDMINIYLVRDVLIDAGTSWAKQRIFRELQDREVRLVALTHCHPDHQGSAKEICEHFSIPLACHEADVPAMEGRTPMQPDTWLIRTFGRVFAGPAYPVARPLRDGDEVAGFRVVHLPGHTPGHCIFFRESDRVAVAGDLLANINFITGQPGLRQPPAFFSSDAARNRLSIQALAALKPSLICFGHGPPLHELALLEKYVARMIERSAVS